MVSGRGRNYRHGYNFEVRVFFYFRKLGYFTVRSSGSHGPADVMAVRKGQVLAIQCKTNGYLPKEEKKELLDLTKYGAIPILASRKGRKLFLKDLRDGSDFLPKAKPAHKK